MSQDAEKPVAALILAAGLGTRMKAADLPKVLHRLCGKTLLEWVLDYVREAGITRVGVVIGHHGELVREEFAGQDITWIDQPRQRGTGHAVMCARDFLELENNLAGDVIIAMGDAALAGVLFPGILDHHRTSGAAATLLTADAPGPSGYGRIIRDGETGAVLEIVEEKLATAEQLNIKEVNAGSYVFNTRALLEAIAEITDDNPKGEYLLTDVVAILRSKDAHVEACKSPDYGVIRGVNTQDELLEITRIARAIITKRLTDAGVEIADPESTFIDARAQIAPGVRIAPQTIIQGPITIAGDCELGPMCTLIAQSEESRAADDPAGRPQRLTQPLQGLKIGQGTFVVASGGNSR